MNHLFVNVATIERWSVREPDENFEVLPGWQPVGNVPCNLQEKSGVADSLPFGRNVRYDAVCYFPSSADVRPDAEDSSLADRLTINGKKYLVRAVTDQTGRGKFLKAFLAST